MIPGQAKKTSRVVSHKDPSWAPSFWLIINDIHIPLTAANIIILYVDDTVLYCAGKSSNDIEHQLNNELQKVADSLDQKITCSLI